MYLINNCLPCMDESLNAFPLPQNTKKKSTTNQNQKGFCKVICKHTQSIFENKSIGWTLDQKITEMACF